MEKVNEYKQTAYMCLVDITKAFDMIKLYNVLKLLRGEIIDLNILEVIKGLINNSNTCIKLGNKTFNQIPISTGIRQGEIHSIMDEIIREVKHVGREYIQNGK